MLALSISLGCEREEAPVEPPAAAHSTNGAADATETSPILPGAPWFKLPANWSEQHPTMSPNAKLETHWLALAEREAIADPGDGGGRAWLEAVYSAGPQSTKIWQRGESVDRRPAVSAASHQRFEIIFEVGEEGIDEGGLLFLSSEAFWFWSEAQTGSPLGEGFTTARLLDGDGDGDGVRLVPGEQGAAFRVEGRSLSKGERIEVVYGAGSAYARVDRYAERGAEIMIAIDADGDGFRRWIEDSPRLDIHGRTGARMVAYGPADAAPGESFEVVLALVDGRGNRARWLGSPPRESEASVEPALARFDFDILPESTLGLAGDSHNRTSTARPDESHRVTLTPASGVGTLRLKAIGRGPLEGLEAVLPPIIVRESDARLVWGDLHGHSQLSDGTGTPSDYFDYARDVARLDVIALTDHDHWGPRPLDERQDLQDRLFATIDAHQVPGRFITIPGFEWTSWIHGHRHVLYFDAIGDAKRPQILSSIDEDTDRPDELWSALRGKNALTFAHHSAGEPIATNWAFAPDPILEPVTEIASVHGQSESPETPLAVRGGIPGYFVSDTLAAGYRLGFIGSGDSHDGHPGLAQIASGQSGLAGLFVRALDRTNVLDTLRRRHTFATNGIRPFFSVTIDETPMGETRIADATEREPTLLVRYEGTAPVERVELVRNGRRAIIEGDGTAHFALERTIPSLSPGDFHYVRVIQTDGGIAWSSPIFVDAESPNTPNEAPPLEAEAPDLLLKGSA